MCWRLSGSAAHDGAGHQPHLNGAARPRREDWRDSGEPNRSSLSLEWSHEIQPRAGEWIVKGLLPSGGIASLYGPSRAGKSFLALDWSLRLAAGDDVLGLRSKRVGVAYVAAEAVNGVRKRFWAMLRENGFSDDHRLPFAIVPRAVDLSSTDSEDLTELIELLQDARIEFSEEGAPLGVVVIDTLARSLPGVDENSGAEMGDALAAIQRIADELNVLVCVVHHVGKDATKGARGHSSFFAALDTAIELSHEEDSGIRRLKIAKQKDDEDGREWAFRLRSVEIGRDADDDPVTSCVVDYVDAPAQLKRRKMTAGETILLRAIAALISDEKGVRSPDRTACPATQFAVRIEAVRERSQALGISDASSKDVREAVRKAVARAKEQLIANSQLFESEGWLWLPAQR